MKPSLDQCLVIATVASALAYFVVGAIRARRSSGKCGGGCGCSQGAQTPPIKGAPGVQKVKGA